MQESSFDEKLQQHLWKAELDYRAKHQKEPCCIEWLAPHCNHLSQLYRFLRSLGYRDLQMISDRDTVGDKVEWVQTKHFCVYTNTMHSQGFFAPPGL